MARTSGLEKAGRCVRRILVGVAVASAQGAIACLAGRLLVAVGSEGVLRVQIKLVGSCGSHQVAPRCELHFPAEELVVIAGLVSNAMGWS